VYAIISDRSRQTRVSVGDEILCDLMGEPETGSEVSFDQVLALGLEGQVKIGKPTVSGASVKGEVLGMEKGKKLVIFRFKRRKNIRRKTGHRQRYTRVRITSIDA
jgi:large subunit ribosomal protein L21